MSLLLYDLVKSMTISEKVYFRRISKTHASNENKNYLKIYNVIEKAKNYHETTLSDHFKGTSIEKYLSSEVNYLKEKILICLFNFSMNKTKRNQIQKGIILVESLASKGFQKDALKKLKFIKKKAIRQEEFTWILRLIELEEILIFKEGILGYRENLEELNKQRSEVINIIQNLNHYHILRQEIRELQFSKKLVLGEMLDIKDVYSNPLIEDSSNCLSLKAKEHWYYIHVLLSYLNREFRSGLKLSSEYVEFIYQNKHMFDKNRILPALSNYIFHAALNSDRVHFERGENLLNELSTKKGIANSYVLYILYTRKLELAYYSNDISLTEEFLELSIELINNHLDKYEGSQVQYLLMLIVRACILLDQPEKGIHYSNFWYQNGILPYRKVQARLFSIIIHLKLNYSQLLKSEILLLKKLEKDNVRDKMLIQSFFKFIQSILKQASNYEEDLEVFQKSLETISKQNKEYFTFISFDFHKWSLGLKLK